MRADGSQVTRLTDIEGSDNRPDVLPNGDRIAFVHGANSDQDIYYKIGSETLYVPLWNSNENNPDWSPDGKWIVFQSNVDGDMDIYKLNVESPFNEPSPITTNQYSDICPDWSPNGLRIAYTSNRDGDREIYIKNSDGSNRQRLTNNSVSDRCPTWSPDGDLIAFLSDRNDGGDEDIWIMNSDGTGKPWQLTNMGVLTPASWSPDGKWLAFGADPTGNNREIFIVSLNGEVRNISKHPDTDMYPVWISRKNLNSPIYEPNIPIVD